MKIIISNNGWTTKISGGDVHTQKTAELWSREHTIIWFIPKLGLKYLKNKICGDVVVTNTIFEKESQHIFSILLLYSIRIVNSIRRIVKNNGEIGIASSHFLYDIIPLLFLKIRNPNCKLVVFFHGLPDFFFKGNCWRIFRKINDFISLIFLKSRYDIIFVINSEIRDYLEKNGVDKNKIYITNNGVDINEYCENIQTKLYEACFLGRIVRSKGILDLIEIWKELIKEYQYKLVIIGDGPDKKFLQDLIETNSLEKNIILTGHLDDEKYSIIAKSSVFLFPSYSESWGIAIAEAMSIGTPVIAYDLPIYKEIFNDTIKLVEKGNTEMMRKIFLEILFDEKLKQNLSARGKNFIKRYAWYKIAQYELSTIQNLDH